MVILFLQTQDIKILCNWVNHRTGSKDKYSCSYFHRTQTPHHTHKDLTQKYSRFPDSVVSSNGINSGSRNFVEGGPRNMKYKPPYSAAIFFLPILLGRGGGGMALLAPPGSATGYPVYTALYAVDMIQYVKHEDR